MTKLLLLVLVGALAAITFAENDGYVPPQPPIFPPEPPKSSTPEPIPPTTPHPAPTTKSTSAPTKPPTPEPKPTSTTKSTTSAPTDKPTSSTTQKPTSSTTQKPTSTTATPKPSPSPSPTPEPPKPIDPSVGLWQVNYTNSNGSCLMVQFALQVEVPYNTTFNRTYKAHVDVPKNATADGECNNVTQSITLTWSVGTNVTDQIMLNFTKDNTTKKYRLADIEVYLTPDNKSFPGANETEALHLSHKYNEFATSVSKSYRCAKKQELNLTDVATNKPRGVIYVSHLQFEAFHNITNKEFSSAEDCSPFETPDVVPIAVGCALAALVIIVLIAYLIGRRRRQARGYLSMFTETKRESDYIPMKTLSCFQ